MEKQSTLLNFRYGFAMVKKASNFNAKQFDLWNRIESKGYVIFTHPEVSSKVINTDHGTAIIVGDVFTCRGDKQVEDIVSNMLVEDSWDEFDNLTGRFCLILLAREVKVLHDPFGSRTVYYRENGEFGVASHAALAASLFGDERSKQAKEFINLPEYKKRGTSYLPGDLTMYDAIKVLIPNNYYDVKSRKTVRYWPRNPVAPTNKEMFLAHCDEYFKRFSSYLEKRYTPLLGLTGGVDARSLIAGLRGHGLDLRLVTWTASRLPAEEVPIVEKMVSHLNCPHTYLDPTKTYDNERYRSIKDATVAATGYSRSKSKISALMGQITNERNGDLFVRGYGGEIIRGFYNRQNKKVRGDLVKDLYAYYKTDKVKEPSETFNSFVVAATKGFIKRANYESNFYNIDIRDLFYWEQRMGTWAANMHNEMDSAVYSITGLNSRPLYETAFGLAPSERLGEQIMLDITSEYDKKFAKMGVVS